MRTFVLISACFAFAVAACSGSTEEDPTGQAGTAGSGTGGAAGNAGKAGAAGSTAGSAGSSCKAPVFSSNCAEVPSFQCGFSASCDGHVAKASWHHHYTCDGTEQIAEYTCTSDCGETACFDGYVGWPQSGAQFVNELCGSGTAGAGGTAGSGGAGTAGAGTAGTGGCEAPSFSDDCSQVASFQCGFSASCEGKTAKVSWHHHVMCNGQEEIVPFSCTYACASECDDQYMGWPQNGAKLVEEICGQGAAGTAGTGGSAGDGGNCTAEHGSCADTAECCDLWEGNGGAAGGQQSGTMCEPAAKTCEHCSKADETCAGANKCCPGLVCADSLGCVYLPD